MLTPIRNTGVYHGHHLALLDVVAASERGVIDTLIADTPYSAETTDKHNDMAKRKNEIQDGITFRDLDYPAWDEVDVQVFVREWSPRVAGWFVVMTDDHLAPVWREALEEAGRCTFTPLPYVAPGSRFRKSGDGPSCWTVWLVVARPRGKKWQGGWTQPGAYVRPEGHGGRVALPGGKDLWIMQQLVLDYSRAGNIVCDPTCGAGTTLVAAQRHNRIAIGADRVLRHAEIAASWYENYNRDRAPCFGDLPEDGRQVPLFVGLGEQPLKGLSDNPVVDLEPDPEVE